MVIFHANLHHSSMKSLNMDKYNKPTMLVRNKNDILITWENVFECESLISTKYRLQIFNDFKEWQTIYCGKKTRFKIEFLAPCTCYNFRINRLEETLDHQYSDWLYFKAATEDEGPYSSVMHMSRAVKLGKMPLVRKIANTRPTLLEAENKENKTPLIQTIEMGDVQMLQLLITLGSNVNTPLHHNERTPLMTAVYYGQIQIAWILIDKGADENLRDVNGLNILHYAVDSNRLESVEFCVKVLKNLDSQDNNGWTALMRAVILGISDSIIAFLMEQGANQELKDRCKLDFRRHRELLEEFKNS